MMRSQTRSLFLRKSLTLRLSITVITVLEEGDNEKEKNKEKTTSSLEGKAFSDSLMKAGKLCTCLCPIIHLIFMGHAKLLF